MYSYCCGYTPNNICGLQCTLTFSTHLCNQRKAGVSIYEVNIQTSNRCPLSWQLDLYIFRNLYASNAAPAHMQFCFMEAVVQWVVVWSLH